MHYRYLTLEQRETLGRILRAQRPDGLPRLSTPDYGVCHACGADIAYARLLEHRAARHCAACQPRS